MKRTTDSSHKVAIALGGNIGDTLAAFRKAIEMLSTRLRDIACAEILKTSPVDCVPGTPDFLNTALTATFDGTPMELLHFCQFIERSLGRPKLHSSHESRTIDLDILLFDNSCISTPWLTIPHPRMSQRYFVLKPLSQLLPPTFIIPGTGKSLGDCLAAAMPSPKQPLRGEDETAPKAPRCAGTADSETLPGRANLPLIPEFVQLIVNTLAYEWGYIAKGILRHPEYRRIRFAELPRPSIELVETRAFLGMYYSRPRNTIALSQELVARHPWYAVMDVFYHEVAHQLTDLLHPEAAGEPAHGKTFRLVCRQIGADPAATADNSSLDAWLFTEEGEAQDPLIDRIRKLLVLAEKGDEHEAEVALAKAVEIMAKHDITHENLSPEERHVTIGLGTPVPTLQLDERTLADLLAKMYPIVILANYVPVLVRRNGAFKQVNYRQYVICGTTRNVKIAQYTYDSIRTHIELAWQEFCAQNGLSPRLVRRRRDFAYGALTALQNKMQSSLDKQTMALVHQRSKELDDYYDAHFPKTTTYSYSSTSMDREAYDAGKEAGRNITIKQGIDRPEGPKMLSR